MKPSMLILCTGNSARSQMAEGFMKEIVGDQFNVGSTGLDPKPLNPLAVQAMQEVGIAISQHYSKDVRGFLGQHFTYLITVCRNAEERCPIFPGVVYRLFWPFDDPAAVEGTQSQKLNAFREVRDQIRAKIYEWYADYQRKAGVTQERIE